MCGSKVASGSQGACGGGSARVSFTFASDALCLSPSVPLPFALGAAAALRRSGLFVLDTSVSRVVTKCLSVLLSSVARLAGLGFPEADRLCDVPANCGCGDGAFCLDSDCWVLKLSWALMRGLPLSPADVPFVALRSVYVVEVRMEADDMAAVYI